MLLGLLLAGCATTAAPRLELTQVLELRSRAEQAYGRGEFDAALPLYRELVAQLPDDGRLRLRLGNLLARAGELAGAVEQYQKGLTLDPAAATLWHNLAMARLRQGVEGLLQAREYLKADDPGYRLNQQLLDQLLAVDGLGSEFVPAPVVAGPRGAGGSHFQVELGRFATLEGALGSLPPLVAAGVVVSVVPVEGGVGLRLGPFASRVAAEAALARLPPKGGGGRWEAVIVEQREPPP